MTRIRNLGLVVAIFLLTAASLGASALFQAKGHGADLRPIDGADAMVQILQGSETVLWTSLSGTVGSYRVEGWPVTIGDNELGGALVIERPADGSAGVIDLGEKPRSIQFELDR